MDKYRIVKYNKQPHFHWAVLKRRFLFFWEVVGVTINHTQAERILKRLQRND